MNRARWVIAAVVVGGLIGSGITLGVKNLSEPDHRLTSSSYGGSTMDDAEPGKAYTFDGGSVCVSGAYARITSVRPRTTEGDIEVSGFKVVDGESELDPTTPLVTTKCKPNTDVGERLFIDVRADTLPAAADGYTVEYVIDGQKKTTFNTNFGLLCDSAKKDQDGVIYGEITPQCYE